MYNSLESEILGALTRLTRTGVSVALQWVSAHVRIHGNEVADALAQRGAMSRKTQDPGSKRVMFPPSTGDITAALRGGAWLNWGEEYERLARARRWTAYLLPSAGTR